MTITETKLDEMEERHERGHFDDSQSVAEYVQQHREDFSDLVAEVRRLAENNRLLANLVAGLHGMAVLSQTDAYGAHLFGRDMRYTIEDYLVGGVEGIRTGSAIDDKVILGKLLDITPAKEASR